MNILETDPGLKFLDLITYPALGVEEGSFAFLTGRSGSGKSTYLKILNRMIIPTTGGVWFQGTRIEKLPVLNYRRRVLLVPQEVYLIDGTIRDNFKYYAEARESRVPTDDEIASFLKLCELDFKPGDNCTNFSGGERQRVFLSIFISFAERVLLLDEPTAALDEKTAFALMDNLKKYTKEKDITVLCVSHSREIVERFADQILTIGKEDGNGQH